MELRSYRFWKRLMDISLSVVLLLPFLALGLLVVLVSFPHFRCRLFFSQQRLGFRNSLFRIYKFTTLLPEKGKGRNCSPDERQTAWGRFMRDYSLDELPQLLNILKGDMSFVGPRPLLPEYENIYSPEEARRHQVRPGLTGLAQVNGRNALSWNEKMHFDQEYVENFSFRQDLQIMMKTLGVIFRGQKVNYGNSPNGDSPTLETPAGEPLAQPAVYLKQPPHSQYGMEEKHEMQWKQA